MELQIESIITKLLSLIIDENKIIKIQKWFRGCILRLKQLPLIMYKIKKYLNLQIINFSTQNEDGRINSCIDEDNIIKLINEISKQFNITNKIAKKYIEEVIKKELNPQLR